MYILSIGQNDENEKYDGIIVPLQMWCSLEVKYELGLQKRDRWWFSYKTVGNYI